MNKSYRTISNIGEDFSRNWSTFNIKVLLYTSNLKKVNYYNIE